MSKDSGVVTLTMFMHQTVMIPLKSVHSAKSDNGGFKNTVIYGVLMGYDDVYLHLGDGTNITAAVPRSQVGSILTEEASFISGDSSEFSGPGEDDEIM